MATYKIYHKDGSVLADANGKEIEVHSIEYNGTWMGECFVTVTFENEAPIDFSIGDYIEYRGERFEINYDPGKIKCASKDSYGGAFKYDSVKFNALSDELVRCDMLDLVLYDNKLHYTALPQFTFYVESLDDLLDRIQANLDELYGKASWKLYSRNKQRSIQRGGLESEWNSVYGEGTADNVIDSTSISISDQTCWDALSLVNSQFDVNFIIRNRNVYVGTAGMPTSNIFKYGKDKGLYEIEQNSESDQAIVTRLRAYGSNRNLPNHYYADLGGVPFLNITGDYHEGSTENGLSVMMEDSTYAGMFTDIISDNGTIKHCRIRGSIDGYEFDGTLELVKKNVTKSTTRLLAEGKEVSDAIKAKIDAGIVEVDFVRGANKAKFDGNRINYVSNLPNNMACDRLMLPGFPNKSLKEWWDAQSAEKKAWLNPSGKEHIFSNDIYRPYVDSLNIEKIGIRPSSVFFDQDDKVNGIVEIYPTIEEMEVDGVRIDEIYTGTNVEDDGRFGDDVSDIANVAIYLSPKINFDIRGLMQEDFTIHMKDGMCAGREFKVAGCTKEKDGSWKLMIERKPDDSLNLYFPYNGFQIKKGDHFVLSGIELPDAYVEAASEKLLRYCIAYLDKNDYTRYVYQPKVDEIFMARQHDTAMADASGLTKSLYLTLKEGDIMLFKDDDLGIDAEITIDQLTIKEEDGKIPTYEITLREEKEVGTIQKIQNQISSITNGNGGSFTGGTGGGGLSSSQIKNLIDSIGSDRFLSKLNPDTAAGIITFLQGTNWGNFTSETGAAMTVDPNTGQTYMEVDRLKVRLKAFFEQLEIQKVGFVGGKLIVTKGQGVDILDVENIYDTEGNISAYRCYFLGEQEGRKIDNLLAVNDQMMCKNFNINAGSTDGATNKYYWRLVTAVSSDVVKRGNYVCHWVDLSATDCDTNSDIPEIGDTICHLGNRKDTDRQGAEILSVVDANSPSFTIYAGINSYSLVNKEYIDMGVSEGKAYCNIYGSTYIGDRERNTGYLRWNDDTKTFEIKGTIDISSPLSSGGTIGGAINNAANAYKGDFNSFTSNVNEIIGGFQAQIDGVIETWFYDPEPKLDNLPASEWKDNDTKDKHLGDLYYSKDGLAYRFQKEGDIYKWVRIDDTAITSALKEAKAAKDAAAAAQGTADTAQTTANSKMKVFVKQPTDNDEYSVGDMWVNATYPADGSTYNNEILHCVTAKAAGKAFSISHWAQSSNIKTQFNNFVNNTYAEDKKDFYNQLDGKVETWYQKDDPKDKWAAADYSKHKGDIWYNDTTNKSYRWTGTAWVELKDQAAIDAKALAESKRRVFTTTTLPTPPYDARDLWVQGENGDIMVCVTPKAAGETASASDWAKASKYTDDTKAKEALAKVGDLQTDVTELGESFDTLTNTTLPALSDGIITTSEKENIRQALMQVQKECVDVINAYTNLTVTYKSIYDKIAAGVRTNFATAYTNLMGSATLSSDGTITYTSGQGGAYGALVDNINALLNKEGNLTTNEIATINNNIANFNIKYNDFQNRLVVVRNDIEKTLDTRITDVDEQLGGYAYLKKIVGGKTTIDGGLVLTTMLGTGYEVTGGAYKIMSGISGLYETAKSVAIWAGGSMIDKFVYYDAESGKFNVPADVNPANFLVRMDGTGYAAGGNFWWDNDGKIHADPQSFLINEQYVGNVMQLFQLHYKVAGDTAFTNVDYVTPTRMFNGLELSDLGLKIGDTAKFYIKDGVLFLEGDLAVTGGITMYASNGVTSGLLDQVYAILDSSKFEIKNGVITIKGDIGDGKVKGATLGGVAVTLNANGILEFDAYPTTLPASDVYAWAKAATKPTYSWGEITEKPSSFTPSSHTHTFASLTSKPTTLSGYGITDAKIANGVITLGTATITPLTAHQTVTLASGTNNGTLKLTVGSKTTDNIAVKGLGSAAYTASSAYAAASHTHAISQITNLQATLDGKAAASHTHSDYVTSLGTNGNYLTWTKNGSTSNITVPYAVSADYANGIANKGTLDSQEKIDNFITASRFQYALFNGSNNLGFDGNDGMILSMSFWGNVNYGAQMAFDDTTSATVKVRGKFKSWGSWYTLLHSGNYNDYAPTKTGTGASGTWGISVTGNAATATTASKLGTDTVGGGAQHFYLNAGTATASTSTVGGTAKPMYLNAGVMTAISATVGGTAKPIFLNAGTLTAISATVGSASKPVYLSGGSITACSYDFTSYLPLAGGTMAAGARISHADGNMYIGRSDNNGWVMCQDMCSQSGSTYWKLMTNGTFHSTVAVVSGNTSVGSLTINGINVTKSSDGILKIDGNLIVTGGITMYSSDGSSIDTGFGQMLADYVDNETIVFTNDKLRALQTGTVKTIIMGSTTYTPNDSGAVTLPEKVTWANIEGKPSSFTPSSHTHAISQITNLQATLDGKAAASHTHANYLWAQGGNDFDPATMDGYYVGMTTKSGISTDWWHILSTNWGTTNTIGDKTWASQLAIPTVTRRGLRYRTGNGSSAYSEWVTVLDSTNYGSYALPLSGGTMTGTITGNTGNGLVVQSANTGSWKEGIRVYPASNNYALISLQDSSSNNIFAMVTNVSSHEAYFDYKKDGVYKKIDMPFKSGTLALTSDNVASSNYASSAGNADTVDGEHASNFSYTHQPSFDFSKSKSGRIVTFDQSGTDYGWINGFASTHNNYLTSIIFNTHRTANWYVGYIEADTSTGVTKGLTAVRQLAFLDSKVADSDKLDGIHADGLLTALSNSNNGISITVGGTTKSVSNISVNYANSAGNASSATKLTSSAGSATLPIYFSDGKPVACTMSTGNGAGIVRSFGRGAYTSANQYFGNGTIVTIDPIGTGCISANDTILSLGDLPMRNTQLLVAYDRDGVYYRRITDGLSYGDWKRLAFTTDNVTSASKWATARKITLTGSVTGSVYIDGSGDVTLATTTNHTHSYLPLSGGTVNGNFVATGKVTFLNEAKLKMWNVTSTRNSNYGAEMVFVQTSIDSADPETTWPDKNRNDLFLQPKGGHVHIGPIETAQNYTCYVAGTLRATDTITAPTFSGALSGNASSATKLTSSAGSATLPIYFSDGKPVACTASSVFSNLSNSGNNISVTVAGQNRTLTVGYASNADTLDGNHASAFAAASHTHAYLPLSGGTMTGQIQRAGQGSSWIKGRDNAMIRVNSKSGYSVLSSIKTTNGSWEIGHYDASGYNNNLLFGYYTDGDYSANNNSGQTKITFTSGGQVTATQFNGALSGNASTATNADKLDGEHSSAFAHIGAHNNLIADDNEFTFAPSGFSGTVYINWRTAGGFNGNITEYKLCNGAKALLGTIIHSGNYSSYALPLSGGTMTANARISYASGSLYLGRADNSGWVKCQDMCSQSGDTYWKLMANGDFTATSILSKGGITMYSDLRKKNILSDEVLSVKEIAAAPLFAHTYKSDENHYLHIGTSAQYWSAIHEDWFTRKDSEGYYQMELQNLGVAMGISLAREIVKYESKTDKKIRLMRKKINELEKANESLEARVKELEERRTA